MAGLRPCVRRRQGPSHGLVHWLGAERTCLSPVEQPQSRTMPRPSYRFRRLLTVVAAVLVIGVAVHGICQAIEHHDGVKDAVALCAAAMALIATMSLVGGGGDSRRKVPMMWVTLPEVIPAVTVSDGLRSSAAWLQRFQN
jgi:hypothetical protein